MEKRQDNDDGDDDDAESRPNKKKITPSSAGMLCFE